MHMLDIQPKEEWARLEQHITDTLHLSGSVYDAEGNRVTGQHLWCNALCPSVHSNPQSQSGICAGASQYCTHTMAEAREPVLEECDAGFAKLAAPIVVNGEVIGSIGGCGALMDDAEADTFYIGKLTGLGDETLEPLAATAPRLTRAQAEATLEELAGMAREIAENASGGQRG